MVAGLGVPIFRVFMVQHDAIISLLIYYWLTNCGFPICNEICAQKPQLKIFIGACVRKLIWQLNQDQIVHTVNILTLQIPEMELQVELQWLKHLWDRDRGCSSH